TDVAAQLQPQVVIVILQDGQNDVRQDVFGRGYEVQAADAAEVRLHEAQRVLPHGTDEIDHCIQPAEDRIILAMTRPPTFPQPFFLLRLDAQHVADGEILQVHFRQPFESVLNRLRYEVDVRQLVGQHGNGTRQHPDGIELAVAQVDQ